MKRHLLVDMGGLHRDVRADQGNRGAGEQFAHRCHQLRRALRADAVHVCRDSPAPESWRRMIEPSYKAHREEMTADERRHFDAQSCDALDSFRLGGHPIYQADTFEADDVIATLCYQLVMAHGSQVVIYSSDKDCHQLLVPGRVNQVTKCNLAWGDLSMELVTAEPSDGLPSRRIKTVSLRERYGIEVRQWMDYRTLAGDPSDNYPGCPGVGAKTAADLLQLGTLDEMIAEPDRFRPLTTPVRRANFAEWAPTASRWRRILTLRSNVPDLKPQLPIRIYQPQTA